MRREELFLTDIIEAADAIQQFIAGVQLDDFLRDTLRQSAVLQKLIVIGEAAAQISTALRDRYPDIEWRKIVGFRNIVVHKYFAIDLPIVWVAATQDVPDLRRKVAWILTQEFGASDTD